MVSLNFFVLNVFVGDFDCVWGFGENGSDMINMLRLVLLGWKDFGMSGVGKKESGIISMVVDSLENLLFWLFFM